MGFPLFPALVATMSLGVSGRISAILAGTAILGLAAYSVSKRMRYLGIRMAVGAQSKTGLWTALGQPIRLLGIGSAVGLALALVLMTVVSVFAQEIDRINRKRTYRKKAPFRQEKFRTSALESRLSRTQASASEEDFI